LIPLEIQYLLFAAGDKHKFMHLTFENPKTREYVYFYRTKEVKRSLFFRSPERIIEKIKTIKIKGPTKEEVENFLTKQGFKKALVFRVSLSGEDVTVFLVTACDDPECPVCSKIEGITFIEEGGLNSRWKKTEQMLN